MSNCQTLRQTNKKEKGLYASVTVE